MVDKLERVFIPLSFASIHVDLYPHHHSHLLLSLAHAFIPNTDTGREPLYRAAVRVDMFRSTTATTTAQKPNRRNRPRADTLTHERRIDGDDDDERGQRTLLRCTVCVCVSLCAYVVLLCVFAISAYERIRSSSHKRESHTIARVWLFFLRTRERNVRERVHIPVK